MSTFVFDKLIFLTYNTNKLSLINGGSEMNTLITGAQCRMARSYLRMSEKGLAKMAGIGLSTLRNIESVDGVPSARIESIQAVRDALLATEKVKFEGFDSVTAIVESTPGKKHYIPI